MKSYFILTVEMKKHERTQKSFEYFGLTWIKIVEGSNGSMREGYIWVKSGPTRAVTQPIYRSDRKKGHFRPSRGLFGKSANIFLSPVRRILIAARQRNSLSSHYQKTFQFYRTPKSAKNDAITVGTARRGAEPRPIE